MSSDNLRLFVAFALSKDIDRRLGEIIRDLRPYSQTSDGRNSVKWVDAGKIHLTIKFLGATPSGKVDSIVKTIADAVEPGPRFDEAPNKPMKYLIERVGAFPNLSRPRVLWVNLNGDLKRLSGLVSKIEVSFERIGIPREKRSFKPHLTLGRVREKEDVSALARFLEMYQIESIPVALDRVVLFKSD